MISEDLVHAQYENFKFGKAGDENGVSLAGEILLEIWEKKRHYEWELLADFIVVNPIREGERRSKLRDDLEKQKRDSDVNPITEGRT